MIHYISGIYPVAKLNSPPRLKAKMVEQIHLAHLPQSLQLYITAYTDVQNAPFLRAQLLAGNQSFNYAFIDASSLLSRRHLLAACFRALNDHLHDRLKSNNVQSEIVFCLSPNNNIGDAFKRFGIQDSSTNLVVVKVGDGENVTKAGVEEHLAGAINGTEVGFSDEWARGVCDLDRLRKTYKIAKPPSKGKVVNGDHGKDGAESEREELEAQVLGLMALRGAT